MNCSVGFHVPMEMPNGGAFVLHVSDLGVGSGDAALGKVISVGPVDPKKIVGYVRVCANCKLLYWDYKSA